MQNGQRYGCRNDERYHVVPTWTSNPRKSLKFRRGGSSGHVVGVGDDAIFILVGGVVN
jgi:hypothetical protein